MKNEKDPFDTPFFKDTDNYIKKQKRKFILIGIIFLVFWSFVAVILVNTNEENKKSIKNFVGKEVVIEKDTLVVIDYSTLQSTYKLSNGMDYDMDFIKSKIIK